MRYLNVAKTLFTYQSRGGEVALGRCEIRTVTPEILGFASAITSREIVEAVFVPSEWADLATWMIETGAEGSGIAALLAVHLIPYRYPSATATATVVSFPARSDEQPTQQVA